MPRGRHLIPSGRRRLAERLRKVLQGRVSADRKTLRGYSRDQSIYEIEPLAVAFPMDTDDLLRLVLFAGREGLPVTPRGGGSGTAGSSLGEGIVIALPDNDFWGGISGFTSRGGSAAVCAGAGVYHNKLQSVLRAQGFFLPADVTSASISRIGGNIATRASGPHALRYGSIDHFLEQVEFITARGEVVDTADEATIPERIKKGLADIERRIRADRAAGEVLGQRRCLKTASGYNLLTFLDDHPLGRRVVQLLAGSVGTLGLVTRATLRAEVYEQDRAVMLIYFDDLAEAGRAVCGLRELGAAAIELISRETVSLLRRQTTLPNAAGRDLLRDAHILMVEMTGRSRIEQTGEAAEMLRRSDYRLSAEPFIAESEGQLGKLWELRKQILWLIQRPGPHLRAIAVVNDVGVPPEHLAAFISDVQKVFDRHGVLTAIYGHAGDGNLHLRPLFNVALPGLRERIQRLADDVYEAVFRYGGTITAEHGMGRLRAPYLRREWGETLHGYMKEIKSIFDPGGLLNPEVMFSDRPLTDNVRPDLFKQRTGRVNNNVRGGAYG